MKRHIVPICIALITIFSVLIPQYACAKEKSAGLRGGYTTRNETAVAGVYFQYRFCDRFRLAPSIDYSFSHYNADAYSFNIDGHIPFDISPKLEIYPLAGLAFSSYNQHNIDDSSSRINRFGGNIGAGIGLKITSTLRLGLEGKYQYLKHFNAGVFNVSIGYIF